MDDALLLSIPQNIPPPTSLSLSLSLSEARSSIEKQKKSKRELQSNPGGRDDESHDGNECRPKVDQAREDLRPGWEDPGALPVSPIAGGVWAQSPRRDPKEHKADHVRQVAEDPVHVFPLHPQGLHGLLMPLEASKETRSDHAESGHNEHAHPVAVIPEEGHPVVPGVYRRERK